MRALVHDLPLLTVYDDRIGRKDILSSGYEPIAIPSDAGSAWANDPSFRQHFSVWADRVRARRDVFMGYCSRANASAGELRDYLERKGFTVLDWSRDFKQAGSTIFEEIERAAARCRCAVFLFTQDDELEQRAKGRPSFYAVPRDNVLLEAGYFMQARGKERVAIVREIGAN